MEGLVNYSSEEEQDDYRYTKVAVRERGGAAFPERTDTGASGIPLKRSYEHSKSSCESASNRKSRDGGNDRFKSGNSYYNEDKYKIDRRADKSRDYKEKRDSRESKTNRDMRADDRDYDYSQKYDHKKLDDHKRYREPKREYKRNDNDYHRDDKRYNRYDEKKTSYVTNNKDRFSSKPRFDDRKSYDDRSNDERRSTNDERRGSGPHVDDRRKEFNDRRNFNNDDRKSDRRYDDRRTQRSYNEDRSNAYRPRCSNSPLPSYQSKSNNKYSERREDSSKRRERKRYSRSKSRSRSHSPDNSMESNVLSINNAHQVAVASEHIRESKLSEAEIQTSDKKCLPTARNFEVLLSLPLGENAPKHPNIAPVPATSAGAAAGSTTTTATVQLPSYYNPNVINPNKYVEQMQKRKLIWGAKKTEDCASKWGHAQFSQDQDGKVASKFMRLMGIKNSTGTGGDSSTSPNEIEKKSVSSSTPRNTDVKSREVMFSTMEHQYEVARQVTHTMRGVGLGFSSQPRPF